MMEQLQNTTLPPTILFMSSAHVFVERGMRSNKSTRVGVGGGGGGSPISQVETSIKSNPIKCLALTEEEKLPLNVFKFSYSENVVNKSKITKYFVSHLEPIIRSI